MCPIEGLSREILHKDIKVGALEGCKRAPTIVVEPLEVLHACSGASWLQPVIVVVLKVGGQGQTPDDGQRHFF